MQSNTDSNTRILVVIVPCFLLYLVFVYYLPWVAFTLFIIQASLIAGKYYRYKKGGIDG